MHTGNVYILFGFYIWFGFYVGFGFGLAVSSSEGCPLAGRLASRPFRCLQEKQVLYFKTFSLRERYDCGTLLDHCVILYNIKAEGGISTLRQKLVERKETSHGASFL